MAKEHLMFLFRPDDKVPGAFWAVGHDENLFPREWKWIHPPRKEKR